MASELIAGISLFKSMLNMAKGLKDMNDAAVRNGAVIELQEKILSAREQQAALLERISDLEKEVAHLEAWESEKERYQLEQLPPGILIYSLKPGMENGEPSHKICADCYNQGVKSYLHVLGEGNGLTRRKCNRCGFDLHTGHFIQPQGPIETDYF
jgi:hypothetical protein